MFILRTAKYTKPSNIVTILKKVNTSHNIEINKYISHNGIIGNDTILPNHLIIPIIMNAIPKYFNGGHGSFLSNIKKEYIDLLTDKQLGTIIVKDNLSIRNIPNNRIEKVLNTIDSTYKNSELLHYFWNLQINSSLINKHFSNISLYQLLDSNKQVINKFYVEKDYNPSDMGIGGGSYGGRMYNPIIFDLSRFIQYTKIKPSYVSKIELSYNIQTDIKYCYYLEVANIENYHIINIEEYIN